MYAQINRHAAQVVGNIAPSAISAYNAITRGLQQTNVATNLSYQAQYKGLWRMRFPSRKYLEAYFRYLESNKNDPHLDPNSVGTALYTFLPSLQFSFATKMAHVVNPCKPVYDSLIAQFFFLPDTPSGATYAAKLADRMNCYSFLETEYRRITANRLLAPTIAAFRAKFPTATAHTDEKVIDWVIWSFVRLANQGAFLKGSFQHG